MDNGLRRSKRQRKPTKFFDFEENRKRTKPSTVKNSRNVKNSQPVTNSHNVRNSHDVKNSHQGMPSLAPVMSPTMPKLTIMFPLQNSGKVTKSRSPWTPRYKLFTKKRQDWVAEFKTKVAFAPATFGIKSFKQSRFLTLLTEHVQTKLPDVTIDDVRHWAKLHKWITDEMQFHSVPKPSTPKTSPRKRRDSIDAATSPAFPRQAESPAPACSAAEAISDSSVSHSHTNAAQRPTTALDDIRIVDLKTVLSTPITPPENIPDWSLEGTNQNEVQPCPEVGAEITIQQSPMYAVGPSCSGTPWSSPMSGPTINDPNMGEAMATEDYDADAASISDDTAGQLPDTTTPTFHTAENSWEHLVPTLPPFAFPFPQYVDFWLTNSLDYQQLTNFEPFLEINEIAADALQRSAKLSPKLMQSAHNFVAVAQKEFEEFLVPARSLTPDLKREDPQPSDLEA